MINTKLMLGRNSGGDVIVGSETEPTEPPVASNSDDEIDNYYEDMIPFDGELTDPFDCLPPNEPQLNEQEAEAIRQEQEENGTAIPPISETTEYETEVIPDESTVKNTEIVIDGISRVLQKMGESLSSAVDAIIPKKREYKNTAQFDKIAFAKPKDAQPSILPKLMLAAVATIAVSAYFGVEANSYYIANAVKKPTGMQCTFGWLMEADSLAINLTPLYTDIFFTAFGIAAFIMAVVIFFIWDSSSQKKRRREGKEHGAGRLATPSDYKKFKKRFMD